MVLTSSPVGSDSWNRSIVIRQKTSLFLMCIRQRLKVGSRNEKDLHQLFEKNVHYPECGGWAQPLLKPVYGGRTVYKEMTNGAQGGGAAVDPSRSRGQGRPMPVGQDQKTAVVGHQMKPIELVVKGTKHTPNISPLSQTPNISPLSQTPNISPFRKPQISPPFVNPKYLPLS
jgi:hypothetical protein